MGWSVILTLNLVFLGLLGYIGTRGVRKLAASEEFALQAIELEGVERASEETIRAWLAPALGGNLFELDLNRVREVVRRDPWVRSAAARRVLPGTMRVTVTERAPAALAVIGGRVHLVDVSGHVIGPAGDGLAENLPVLTGLEEMDDDRLIVVGENHRMVDAAAFAALVKAIRRAMRPG